MRAIKFRAWDKKEKQMYTNIQQSYDTIMGIDCNGDIYPRDEWASFGEVLKDGNLEIMQFTGLKDKNGKEIYEGDLVNNHDDEVRQVDFSNGSYWLVGKTREGKVIVDMFEPFILNGEVIQAESMEVIGNIYENPELLNL